MLSRLDRRLASTGGQKGGGAGMHKLLPPSTPTPPGHWRAQGLGVRTGSCAENRAFYLVHRKSSPRPPASPPPPPLPGPGPTAPPSSAGSPQGPPRRELLPASCAMVVWEVEGQVEWETMGIRIGGGGSGRRGCGSFCTQRPRLRRWRSAAGAGSGGGGGGERGVAEEGRSWNEKAGRGEMGEELLGREGSEPRAQSPGGFPEAQ